LRSENTNAAEQIALEPRLDEAGARQRDATYRRIVVRAFEAIDDRSALQRDTADIGCDFRMRVDTLHRHAEVQLDRVGFLPTPSNVCIPTIHQRADVELRAVDLQSSGTAPAGNTQA